MGLLPARCHAGGGPSQRCSSGACQQADALSQGLHRGHCIVCRLLDTPPLSRPAPEAALCRAGGVLLHGHETAKEHPALLEAGCFVERTDLCFVASRNIVHTT